MDFARAGFTSGLGTFEAGWNVTDGGEEWEVWWVVPEGTTGVVSLPVGAGGGNGSVSLSEGVVLGEEGYEAMGGSGWIRSG